ncbi:ribosome silencing factor [Caldalkalibacillus thermarum TA2.A1]|uniref:Ribosomal silencing factor RsfS n=1 Tax=Caldalkalibacillus thermarum (strain TA2.A1) TaxID=986075 RepID=A0A8X8LAX2_CALTT|nr:ribosome silencing factor [Caldalkalibacillus thermarum]QZT33415.1 ribosome silencing factor [Caldalkalibacillus thermarum TA2.A1]
MKTQDLLKAVVDSAEDKKAQDIVVLDIRGLSVVADYFVICHGNSETQVQAIAEAVREKAEEMGLNLKPLEGFEQARWVLIDLGDVIVHVFHREEREFYNLEKIWADAPRLAWSAER